MVTMYDPYAHEDQESTAMSSNYPQSWASSSLPRSVLPPSDNAVQLNTLYLEAKTEMLTIIEEGLQLKLEIQRIKDQFLNLIQDFDDFEQNDKYCAMKYPGNMSQLASEANRRTGRMKMSTARMRVRALYEIRKERIRARRATVIEGQSAELQGLNVLKIDSDDDFNKENMYMYELPTQHSRTIRPAFNDDISVVTSTPIASSGQVPLRSVTWSVKRFLTPIKEEHHKQLLNANSLLRNLHTPKCSKMSRKSHSKSHRTSKSGFDIVHDYVSSQTLLKDKKPYASQLPDSKKDDHNSRTSFKKIRQLMSPCATEIKEPTKQVTKQSIMQRNKPQSVGNIISGVNLQLSPMDFTLITSPSGEGSLGKRNLNSPIQSATSEMIGELYTSKVLKDISLITHQPSKDTDHEQVSDANHSAFHSIFNYPLHSTLNYPLHSTFNKSDINVLKRADNTGSNNATRTTVSEPSTDISQKSSHMHTQPQLSLPKQVINDSYIEYPSDYSEISQSFLPQAQLFTPSGYRTPTKKPQAQLCKEHGIHPTFDGSCIFRSDNSNLNSTDDDLDCDENGNTPKGKVNVAETDCDSSYLSECVDDQHFSIDVDEYIATYDARNACIRMLKRQTGQTELQDIKNPVGLSESDLLRNVTRKNLSLEAIQASLPNISGLSTLPASDAEDDQSESTLHVSSPQKIRAGSVFHESDEVLSPNDTLVSVEQRPLSVSTNEDSPESNTGMPVPVNSPNITDSGGSSSRQNTDNYEYMEMPQEEISVDVDGISLPASHTSHSSRSHLSYRASSSQSHHSHHSSKSHQPHSNQASHRSQRQYSSTPGQLSDAHNARTAKSKSSHNPESTRIAKLHSSHDAHSTRTAKSKKFRDTRSTRIGRALTCYDSHSARSPSTVPSYDWDSGCSSHDDSPQYRHFTISDNTGRRRTIVQHPPVSQNLPQERKKALVKKLKHFSNNFYKATSTGNLQIETLGHF